MSDYEFHDAVAHPPPSDRSGGADEEFGGMHRESYWTARLMAEPELSRTPKSWLLSRSFEVLRGIFQPTEDDQSSALLVPKPERQARRTARRHHGIGTGDGIADGND